MMFMKRFLGMCLLMLPAAAHAVEACRLADQRIERSIAEKTAREGGAEYCQFRRYDVLNDVDGDRKPDIIVTFNIEGAHGEWNRVESYPYVFLSAAGEKAAPLTARAGERGTFWPDGISVRGSTILLHTMKWLSKDPLCCPSGRGRVDFAIKGQRLVRVTRHR
jgi:hypothetical protein